MSEQKPPYSPVTMADVLAAEGKTGLRVASTFSGGGGSCLGYRLAGFSVVWANEFEPHAVETYKRNCQAGCFLNNDDIRTIKASDILEPCGLSVGELDLFDGSPPCQSFSTAGKREKGWGLSIAHGDGTTQRSDDLFKQYIRLVDELRPRTFIAENVTGLVKGTAKGYFKMVLRWFRELGYLVEARVVSAQWLGVPQARQRVIFIGVRKDVADLLNSKREIQIEDGNVRAWPVPNRWSYSVADACPWISRATHYTGQNSFMDKPKEITNQPSPMITIGVCNDGHFQAQSLPPRVVGHHYGAVSESINDPALTLGADCKQQRVGLNVGTEGHPITDDPIDMETHSLGVAARKAWEETKIGETHSEHFTGSRVSGEKPAPTVSAFISDTSHGMAHPYEPRRFTILEVKRLCSFPDDYSMTGKFEQRWARLGNAVPPLMMKAIAAAVRDGILLPFRELSSGNS